MALGTHQHVTGSLGPPQTSGMETGAASANFHPFWRHDSGDGERRQLQALATLPTGARIRRPPRRNPDGTNPENGIVPG